LWTGKPHGLRTARKLRDHRRDQKWHDKTYKKSHLGTRWKSNPFGGASHAKGIVLEKVYVLWLKELRMNSLNIMKLYMQIGLTTLIPHTFTVTSEHIHFYFLVLLF